MQAKEIKNGSIVVYNDFPVLIESLSVQSPSARGAATLYKFKARNLITKQKVDITLKGTESLDEANFERRNVTIMYRDADQMHFLDAENYNQYSLDIALIENELQFIKEGQEGIMVLIYNEEVVGIQIPATVELLVVECEPGVRGNSATSRNKPAKLETGAVIQVPEYLKEGEMVKVDTRSGEFLSRC
ncbi:MAG TPA: elongation factor P [Pirellulaceae bacterium]|nr:elongation factor P [Pirellulaceae bacterium]HMO93960.1 elongation factor P [Pirellulaceae bacterium]HMP67966.1 elongation factor P [Pirellulaceae bacterium]